MPPAGLSVSLAAFCLVDVSDAVSWLRIGDFARLLAYCKASALPDPAQYAASPCPLLPVHQLSWWPLAGRTFAVLFS